MQKRRLVVDGLTMEASRVICTNCRIIVEPKTFKELISIVSEVRRTKIMICRYNTSIVFSTGQARTRLVCFHSQTRHRPSNTFFAVQWQFSSAFFASFILILCMVLCFSKRGIKHIIDTDGTVYGEWSTADRSVHILEIR